MRIHIRTILTYCQLASVLSILKKVSVCSLINGIGTELTASATKGLVVLKVGLMFLPEFYVKVSLY